MIIPAIDLLRGKCVQLQGGDPTKVLFSSDDPIEISKYWEEQGYQLLHVIDLDAAIGTGNNFELIKEIKEKTNLKLQVGGGIRTLEKAKELGFADRLIIGTAAIENPDLIKDLSAEFGREKLLLAVDAVEEMVRISGWKTQTKVPVINLASSFQNLVGRILYTAIEKEGRLSGPNLEILGKLVRGLSIPVIYSGGISSDEDIKSVEQTGAEALVIGTYLYRREFNEKS